MKDESCCSRIPTTVLENKEEEEEEEEGEDGVKERERERAGRVMEKMRREKLEAFRLSRSKN